MHQQKFITIDIGCTWSKAFLVSVDEKDCVQVEQSARLPTTTGNLLVGLEVLLSEIPEKDVPIIFVGSLPEVENLAKEKKADFVTEKDVKQALLEFFKEAGSNVFILDSGASNFKEAFKVEDVGKFLTFPITSVSLDDFLGNKMLRLHNLPNTPRELEIEESFLRDVFAKNFLGRTKEKKLSILLTGGAFSGAPSIARVALLVLDILEKGDIAQVRFDREFFLPSFGALLTKHKQLQVASTGNWLEALGAFVSLGGSSSINLDWGYSQLQKVDIEAEEISLIPAPPEQVIELSVPLNNKEKKTISLLGGSLGIFLDARTKPLGLAFGQDSSRNRVLSWRKDLEKAVTTKEVF